ncbi:MAG: hypothetical protein E4H23_07100 [Chrysiogenales bacterium]|nr:MAG: hypothetical protein E4H23_07100 [Chrysiogenales bacterium]
MDVRWEKLNALFEAGTVETLPIDEQPYACNRSLQELGLRRATILKKIIVLYVDISDRYF